MIGNADGRGLPLKIEVCKAHGSQPNQEIADKVFNEGLKGDIILDNKQYGLVLDIGGYYKNVFTLATSL
jgi:4-aminobutyrate aminotransferase/(S)-3-amino-2-methylpropionate transaminase